MAGWLNYDSDMDLTKPLPIESGTADLILLEHTLEHFDSRQALGILDECFRILKSGGVMRVCCPVIEGDFLTKEHARDLCTGHGHKMVFNRYSLDALLWMAGFADRRITGRREYDGHHKAIGLDRDDLESCRIEGTKP